MFVTGTPVTGDDFIGRQTQLNSLKTAINENRNIGVCGLARIGKSSLVKECIRSITEDNASGGKQKIFIEVSLTNTPNSGITIFRKLYSLIESKMRDVETSDFFKEDLLTIKENLMAQKTDYLPYITLCNEFCEHFNATIWLVIDEMDYAQTALCNAVQNLRELINESEGNVRSVNISRHSLETIFPIDSIGSNYPGIITERFFVLPYNEDDLAIFKEKFLSMYPELTEELWCDILYYTGNVPFFLSLFANGFISGVPQNFSIEVNFPQYAGTVNYWHQAICKMNLINSVTRFLENTATPKDINDLRPYGIIDKNESFITGYFGDFIKSKLGDTTIRGEIISEFTDLLPNIDEVEKRCREQLPGSFQMHSSINPMFRQNIKELEAMRTKINCMSTLAMLDTFVECLATTEELNAFKTKIYDIIRELDTLF